MGLVLLLFVPSNQHHSQRGLSKGEVGQVFSVKGQVVIILGFASLMVSIVAIQI